MDRFISGAMGRHKEFTPRKNALAIVKNLHRTGSVTEKRSWTAPSTVQGMTNGTSLEIL